MPGSVYPWMHKFLLKGSLVKVVGGVHLQSKDAKICHCCKFEILHILYSM